MPRDPDLPLWAVHRARADLIDIAGSIEHETERAYLFNDGTRQVWLPKSRCEWDPDDKTMAMSESLAKEKELI